MQKEIWKDIPSYEGLYQVSNLGQVKSLRYNREKILKPALNSRGYLLVNIYLNKKLESFLVHQLVAIAFLNHKKCGYKKVVDHLNDIKTDNRLENLQLVTARFNCYKTQGTYSSKYKGVHFHKHSNKWQVRIRLGDKRISLGYFKDEHDAHLAYQNKLKEITNEQ